MLHFPSCFRVPGSSAATLKQTLYEDRAMLLFCFLSAFVIGLAVHAYAFFNLTLSHDALISFYATRSEIEWKVALGRFLVPVYQMFFRGRLASPWLIGLLSISFLGLTTYIMTRLFAIRSKLAAFLVCGVLTANLTVIAQAGTFLFELDCNMLALLFSVAAVFFWKQSDRVICAVCTSLLLFLSMGIYQSYVCVAITLILFCSILELLSNQSWRCVLFGAFRAFACVLMGFIFYTLTAHAACRWLDVPLQERVNAFAWGEMDQLFPYIRTLIADTYSSCHSLLTDHPAYNSMMMHLADTTIVLFVLLLVYAMFLKKGLHPLNKLLILLFAGLLPLGMNAIYILSRGFIHDLMIYSLWFAFLFPLLLARHLPKNTSVSIGKGVAAGIALLFLWQNLILANTFYVKKEADAKATLSTMTQVLSALTQREDYVPGQTPVVFIGSRSSYRSCAPFAQVQHITGGENHSSITYYQTYSAYFSYVLDCPINLGDTALHSKIYQHPASSQMPVFPHKDSIQRIDGVMVVKFG